MSIRQASCNSTAGESYSLECSACVTESTDTPNITWLDPMNNEINTSEVLNIMITGSMNTLIFNPLAASHAGTYTCRVTLDNATSTATTQLTVQGKFIL